MTASDPDEAPQSQCLRRRESNPTGLSGPAFWQAYRRTVSGLYDVSLPSAAAEARFSANALIYQTTRASLTRATSQAQVLRRGPQQVAGGADQIVVYLQVDGRVVSRIGKRSISLEPGDLAIYDYAQTFTSRATDFTNLVLAIERDEAPQALLAPGAHGLRLAADSGAGRILAAALTSLFETADHLSLGEAEAAVEAVVCLAAGLVRSVQVAQADVDPREAIQHAAAVSYIDRFMSDPDLGPEQIAEHLGISRAALYRLFTDDGGVRVVILKRRLDAALRLLLSDPHARLTLAAVGALHGFRSAPQFSRTFATRFGLPPSRYCDLIRTQGPEWHADQLRRAGVEPIDQHHSDDVERLLDLDGS